MPYTVGKLKRRAFQQDKNTLIEHMIRKIQPRKIQGLKVGKFSGVPREQTRPKGGSPAEGCRIICMEGGVSHFDSAVVNLLPGVSRRTTNPNCESYVGLDSRSEHGCASLDNELSCPWLACPGPVPDPRLMELELVTRSHLETRVGL